MRVGVISDTHGLVRPQALRALAGVERILHAGDIGGPAVLEALAAIAPVDAVRGNNDHGAWARALPETRRIELAGRSVYVLHDLKELELDPAAAELDVVIAGHSHEPRLERIDGCLYVNPGSAGPRRFSLPICVAILTVSARQVKGELVELSAA